MRFTHDLSGGFRLALRTLDTVEEMHALTRANLERLRRWEPWALSDQTLEGTTAFTRAQLADFAARSVLPTVIMSGDALIGSASLRTNSYTQTAELGYWIDAAAEGRGAVTRACAALLTEVPRRGIRRVEIRTAVENERSSRVAERLGFTREGVLASALPLGDERLDVAVYGRTFAR
ncbi:GNAT family N-acetyltransferase [Rathayibacter sp. ZW T2_19]|uniref:GNAT family N-acetyltransferase n=1 Tax=Rathayibacter rubneri TaxID=2950106 RepID=A0A9X2IRQ1_9MICO|nr:GNAT family protein [Rathayibacter rubneri]MCM6761172.1 GNAT family N-acetyltransferase [Rathayibacter rubneri]